MLESGKLVPDEHVTDLDGQTHRLWDYRQKGHLLLVYEPGADLDRLRGWAAEAEKYRKTWDWLGVRSLVLKAAPADWTAGAYAIDRFGRFLVRLPLDAALWQKAETEFLYYEARHC